MPHSAFSHVTTCIDQHAHVFLPVAFVLSASPLSLSPQLTCSRLSPCPSCLRCCRLLVLSPLYRQCVHFFVFQQLVFLRDSRGWILCTLLPCSCLAFLPLFPVSLPRSMPDLFRLPVFPAPSDFPHFPLFFPHVHHPITFHIIEFPMFVEMLLNPPLPDSALD